MYIAFNFHLQIYGIQDIKSNSFVLYWKNAEKRLCMNKFPKLCFHVVPQFNLNWLLSLKHFYFKPPENINDKRKLKPVANYSLIFNLE